MLNTIITADAPVAARAGLPLILVLALWLMIFFGIIALVVGVVVALTKLNQSPKMNKSSFYSGDDSVKPQLDAQMGKMRQLQQPDMQEQALDAPAEQPQIFYCTSCGKQMAVDSRFCRYCGAQAKT